MLAAGGCAQGESDALTGSGSGGSDASGHASAGAGAGSAGTGAGTGTGAGAGGSGGGGEGGGGGAGGGAETKYIYACSDVYLYRIDTKTLGPNVVVEKVGEFGTVPDRMIDVAVTPDGRLYGVSWNEGAAPSKLWSIDPATAAPTYIAEIPGVANVGLTFMADGRLVSADKGGALFEIDPATGATTDIGALGFGSSGDIVGVADGTLYGFADAGGSSSEAINALITIDPGTGTATEVGLTGFANLWGAAFWCGKLYAFGSDGDLLAVDVKTGKGTLLAAKIPVAKSGFSGAGVTPISPLSTVGGACD